MCQGCLLYTSGNDEVAAGAVRVHPLLHMRKALSEPLDGAVLRRRGRRHDDILMDLVHRLDERRIGQDVSQPPSGHGEGLGKAVDDDDLILDLIELCLLYTSRCV